MLLKLLVSALQRIPGARAKSQRAKTAVPILSSVMALMAMGYLTAASAANESTIVSRRGAKRAVVRWVRVNSIATVLGMHRNWHTEFS